MTVRSTIILTILAFAASALVAGCGGDDSSDGGSAAGAASGDSAQSESGGDEGGTNEIATSSLSKAQFVKRASKACEEGLQSLPERAGEFSESQGPESASPSYEEGVKKVLLPILRASMDQIRKLGAPSGDVEEVEAIVSAQEQAIDEVAELEGFESVDDIAPSFGEARELMVAYGLKACAVTPEP